MSLLRHIVAHMTDAIDGSKLFARHYGLAELRRRQTTGRVPVHRSDNDELAAIDLDSAGLTYIRQLQPAAVGSAPSSGYIACSLDLAFTYRLRLFALTKRANLENPDAYSADLLAGDLIRMIDAYPRTDLHDATKATVTFAPAYVNADSEAILSDEFPGLDLTSYAFADAVVAVDWNVTAKLSPESLTPICPSP